MCFDDSVCRKRLHCRCCSSIANSRISGPCRPCDQFALCTCQTCSFKALVKRIRVKDLPSDLRRALLDPKCGREFYQKQSVAKLLQILEVNKVEVPRHASKAILVQMVLDLVSSCVREPVQEDDRRCLARGCRNLSKIMHTHCQHSIMCKPCWEETLWHERVIPCPVCCFHLYQEEVMEILYRKCLAWALALPANRLSRFPPR